MQLKLYVMIMIGFGGKGSVARLNKIFILLSGIVSDTSTHFSAPSPAHPVYDRAL